MLSVTSFYTNPFDAVGAGQIEVLADERSRFVKASLSRDHELIYPPIQAFWDAALKGTPSAVRFQARSSGPRPCR
jgi:hypothetical protein